MARSAPSACGIIEAARPRPAWSCRSASCTAISRRSQRTRELLAERRDRPGALGADAQRDARARLERLVLLARQGRRRRRAAARRARHRPAAPPLRRRSTPCRRRSRRCLDERALDGRHASCTRTTRTTRFATYRFARRTARLARDGLHRARRAPTASASRSSAPTRPCGCAVRRGPLALYRARRHRASANGSCRSCRRGRFGARHHADFLDMRARQAAARRDGARTASRRCCVAEAIYRSADARSRRSASSPRVPKPWRPHEPIRLGILSFAHYHANFWSEVFATTRPTSSSSASGTTMRARGAESAAALRHALLSRRSTRCWRRSTRSPSARRPPQHRALIERAAARGSHVLCEKPIATTLDDARRDRRGGRTAGVTFMQSFPKRFDPVNHEIKRRLDAGLSARSGSCACATATATASTRDSPRGWWADPARERRRHAARRGRARRRLPALALRRPRDA